MSDSDEKKGQPPKIGGIGTRVPYSSFGGASKHHDDEASKLQRDESLKRLNALTTSQQDDQTATQQDDQTLKRQNEKELKRQNDKNLKRQTIYLPKPLALWLKAHAAITEQDMSDIMTKLLEDYRNKQF
jgi:hypothetical protein